jgi:hypothetical protein
MPDDADAPPGIRKQALHRHVNRRLEQLSETFALVTDKLTILCECVDARCSDRLEVPLPHYRKVRVDDRAFIVAPGHESPALERVAADLSTGRIVVVRPGTGGRSGIALDD